MTRQKVENNHKSSAGPKNILDRFFFGIERFAYTHSFSVIAISLILAALSLWVTVEKLTFKTKRGDLVAKDLPYVQRHEKFRKEFDDFDGMIVVIEGEDPEQKKNFAEALAEKLKSLSIDFEITPCQSLCSYAPTAKINNRAILRADLDTLLDA